MRALGGKKPHGFFGNARPKSNARAHLKQRKKMVALPIWLRQTRPRILLKRTTHLIAVLWESAHCYTRRQIKNDQPGSHDFQRFLRQF